MLKQQERELNLLRADQQREAESMLAEFTQAQDLLKDKIAELQYMLVFWNIRNHNHNKALIKK